MNTEAIIVANLKCSGCAHTIDKNIHAIQGVHGVNIDLDENCVMVDFEEPANRKAITETLFKLGYPEATAENGLLSKVRSYASCMVGRLSKD
jgi:copper chaperone CopZ